MKEKGKISVAILRQRKNQTTFGAFQHNGVVKAMLS